MLEDSKELLATVPEFLEHAKEVKIDSVWSFAVSSRSHNFARLNVRQDAKKAFEKLESGRAVGKIVVTIP